MNASDADVVAFENHLPVRVRFGNGVSRSLGAFVEQLGGQSTFVLIDSGLERIEAVQALLTSVPASVVHFKPAGEPTFAAVESVAVALAEAESDTIVGVGGGSVMDCAKAARLLVSQGGDLRSYVAGRTEIRPLEPSLVLIPTTAGTGSEVSGGAVLIDETTSVKASLADANLRATAALVDPELTFGLPPEVTRDAGVDALAQAIAGVVVNVHTPVGDAIGLHAIRFAAEALPRVCQNPSDRDARAKMMCASLMAGLTMNLADCGAEHSLAQALGGACGCAHGLAVGLVLAETIEHDYVGAPQAFERIADAIGAAQGPPGVRRVVNAVKQLLSSIDFPVLGALDVAERDFERIADRAMQDPFLSVAPVPWSRHDVITAYRSAASIKRR